MTNDSCKPVYKYRKCIVVFLDILGFKNLVNDPSKIEALAVGFAALNELPDLAKTLKMHLKDYS